MVGEIGWELVEDEEKENCHHCPPLASGSRSTGGAGTVPADFPLRLDTLPDCPSVRFAVKRLLLQSARTLPMADVE